VSLFKILWRVHRQTRPQLIEWFALTEMKDKVVRVSNIKEWNRVSRAKSEGFMKK